MYETEIKSFLDESGRLKSYPARFKRQIYALFYLASKFESNKRYPERELNQILQNWHTFEDWATLRRDLVDRHFLSRESDCSFYWLEKSQPTLASFGLE